MAFPTPEQDIRFRELDPESSETFARILPPEEDAGSAWERLAGPEEPLDAEEMLLVAEEAERPVARARVWLRDETGWIFDVATSPEARGRGLAVGLLDELARRARERGLKRLCLHVRADNAPARRCYEKAGFRNAGADGMRGEQLRYVRELG